MAFNNTTLLDQIKARALIPTDQTTYTDADLLELATDEMYSTILPMIMRTRNEFYVTSSDHSITSSSRSIDIPYRAIGLAVRDVVKVSGDDEYDMPMISPENKDLFTGTNGYGFYVKGNKLIVTGTWSGTVRLYYYQRPGSLTETSNARQITAIDTGTNTITVASVPTDWTTSTVIDLVDYRPGFDTLSSDLTISSISGTDIVLPSLPDGLAVNDWITVAETSPVAQIPAEFHPYLAQLVAVKVLEGVGDFEGMQAAQSKLEQLERSALTMISPRIKGEPKKVVGHRRSRQRFNGWRN